MIKRLPFDADMDYLKQHIMLQVIKELFPLLALSLSSLVAISTTPYVPVVNSTFRSFQVKTGTRPMTDGVTSQRKLSLVKCKLSITLAVHRI